MDQKKKQYQPSKEGSVGKDMAKAWKGDRDSEGLISGNYQGRPGNAIPNFNPHTPNPKPPSQWTGDRMKQYREEAKQKKEAIQKNN